VSSIVDQLTAVYVYVDDYLDAHPSEARWRQSNNNTPDFTDAEVIAIGLMQGCFGCASLKKTYRLIADNHADAFPYLPTYQQWLARLHALSAVIGALIQAALLRHRMPGRFYIFDSKPIPVCKPIRHGRVRLLREEGAYFGKTSTGWFFGFKLHALVHQTGAVIAALLTPGNWADQDAALALALSVQGGTALGDHGYRAAELADTLMQEAQMLIITPETAGDDKKKRALVSSLRERVETSFSALWGRFIDRVFSRSWEGLWNTIKLKVLHFNLCRAGILPT
jgi:transposase